MTVLFALLQALVLFAVAPLLSGITRVLRARLHNRRGPGVMQEYRDIIKLLGRQSIGPDASGWVFRLTPFVMVGVMLTIATALPVVTVASPLPGLGDLITLIYLFAVARFFFAIAGLDTGSPFTAIGASREAMLGVLVEPMLLLGLWVAALVAGSTHISNITDAIYHWPASAAFRWCWRSAPAPSPPLSKWANCRSIWRKRSRSCRKARCLNTAAVASVY
ncbi:Hydrogenase 3 component D [Kluyvera cryocrescens]|uniref:Hydrogenase 3 component D n=1 Tax=Kluyvera cryocrescens TaxID=580 RepID=A0A485AR91_KLUCR|nr:Hydrogenase 3 component D [Kluyvera cryocrescens]